MTASWSGPIRVQPNTSVVRAIDRGQWQAPLGSSHGQPPDHRQPAAVLVRQGQAFGGAEEAPSLTAAAPRRRWKYAVGTEECSRRGSNKRMECKGRPKWRDAPLTKKAPYKPHLRKAPERLAGLRTAEGTGLPANIIEEFRRDMARLALVREQISSIEKTRAERLERAPDTGPHAMVRLLARVIGIGIETADMLVREILSRKLRDRRAVARYAGLTESPDESGLKRREKGLAKAGNARVRRGLIQLAWRFLMFQKDSALARWYRTRTEGPSGARKTKMIVALARKLLIALWRLVTTGEVPDGVELRPAL